jgi:hypothetical protein
VDVWKVYTKGEGCDPGFQNFAGDDTEKVEEGLVTDKIYWKPQSGDCLSSKGALDAQH